MPNNTLPTVITKSGLQPQSPASLREQLLARVAATNPGYTVLPAGLIEDISSTDVAALVLIDSARVEAVNSLTPYGANEFTLAQLGAMLGIPIGVESNTSVFVTFAGPPGFVIAKGFTVSDGNHQYVVQDGGIIASSGVSSQLFALASEAGIWTVPVNTVTELITTVPTGITITVNNPVAGVPGTDSETVVEYRARVLQANLALSQGVVRYLKTLLGLVSGVQQRLISVQQDGTKWRVIVGGGDPYEVGYAIWTALFNPLNLIGSILNIDNITAASPGVVETFLNHGLAVGDVINIDGVNPTDYNVDDLSVLAVIDEKTFSLGVAYPANPLVSASWSGGTVTLLTTVDHGVTVGSTFRLSGNTPGVYNGTHVATGGTTGSTLKYAAVSDPGALTVPGQLDAGIARFITSGFPSYVSGGVVTPNPRNITVDILDYPDTYEITFVNPPQQSVSMTVTWDTSSTNIVAPAAVAQLAVPAIVTYINSIIVGQPINLLSLQTVFRAAVESVLLPEQIIILTFSISINGIGTAPTVGTEIVEGDPQSYFYCTDADINVVQNP